MKKTSWPTFEQQLDQAKVIHGSSLEKFIQDNQNFDILNPAEANDNIRLPPWLRVYWRKKNPDWTYSTQDPTGGYPKYLEELYEHIVEYPETVEALSGYE
jgi:hypothetical protein